MPIQKTYNPSVPATLKFISQGKLSMKDASEILDCSPSTVKNLMKEFGVEIVSLNTVQTRKEKTQANMARSELLEKLAKQVKYDKADIHLLAFANNIPSRTLYRWVLKV